MAAGRPRPRPPSSCSLQCRAPCPCVHLLRPFLPSFRRVAAAAAAYSSSAFLISLPLHRVGAVRSGDRQSRHAYIRSIDQWRQTLGLLSLEGVIWLYWSVYVSILFLLWYDGKCIDAYYFTITLQMNTCAIYHNGGISVELTSVARYIFSLAQF